MKLTTYGYLVFIATSLSMGFISNFSIKHIIIIVLSVILQSFLCKECSSQYTLAAYLSVIPLLSAVVLNCNELKELIFAFALGCAIGRIGCYFAGCCTGKECSYKNKFSILYKENHIINNRKKRKNIRVHPTIFLEIILQFLIAFLVYKSKYGLTIYGIGNIALFFLTSMWRDGSRMGNRFSGNYPVIGLILYSIYSLVKCKPIDFKPKFKLNIYYIVLGMILWYVTSNDLNVGHLKRMLIR